MTKVGRLANPHTVEREIYAQELENEDSRCKSAKYRPDAPPKTTSSRQNVVRHRIDNGLESSRNADSEAATSRARVTESG
jgi:hypothetical protein